MSNGKLLHGQQYSPQTDILVPFTEQMLDISSADAKLGQAKTDITPHDANSSLARTYDSAAIASALYNTVIYGPITIPDIDFPPVLRGILVTIDRVNSTGGSTTTATGEAAGTSVSLSLSPRSNGQSSATISPDIQPDIVQLWGRDVLGTEVLFYLASNSTDAQVRARTTTAATTAASTVTITIASPGVVSWPGNTVANGDQVVLSTTGTLPVPLQPDTIYFVKSRTSSTIQLSLTSGGASINTTAVGSGVHSIYNAIRSWPVFKPVAHTIILVGRSISLTAEAALQQQVSIGSSSSIAQSETIGLSSQIGSAIKTVRIPPTLHGVIDLTVLLADKIIVAGVQSTAEITSGTNWPGLSADTGAIAVTLQAAIIPDSLPATTPSSIPTSGLYLKTVQTEPDVYGSIKVRAVIIDFAQFA